MGVESLERFLRAVSYPDRAGVEAGRAVLRIDESEVIVEEKGKYFRFTAALDAGEDMLMTLASYVPGRICRDEATLAIDSEGKLFLWQEAQTTASEADLRHAFEAFLNARDWWLKRTEKSGAVSGMLFSDSMIMP